MKILRTSFAQFVREKILAGENETLPDPVLGKDEIPRRLNCNARDGKILDSSKFGGSVTYREADTLHTDTGGNVWKVQGPVGFGDPPVGPGTKPYYTFLSNATPNLVANQKGIYTGKNSEAPYIPEFTSYIKGNIGIGATWSVGQLEQSYTDDATGNTTDIQCGVGKHVLLSIDSRIRSTKQLTDASKNISDPYALDDNTIPTTTANAIHFIYEVTGDKTYKLYAVRGKWDGYNSTDNIDTLDKVSVAQDFVHFSNSYKRLLPVHFKLTATGQIEFRVETSTVQLNITAMPSADGTNFAFPGGINSGNDFMTYRFGGLDPSTYTGPVVQGMTSPLVVLGNIAINDTVDDGLGNDGLPPFIAGIPLTPIRRFERHEELGNERPVSVIDRWKVDNGTDAWLPYSYSGDPITYSNPLESVVDGQTYDIRGTATKELSANLEINLSYDRIKARYANINAINIEAINLAVENAAVFGANPGELSLAMKITGDIGSWTTDYKRANQLTQDAELDSHVTFYEKTDTNSQSLTGFQLTDFNQLVTVEARAMHTADLP